MSGWLENYALYTALKWSSGKPWFLWPKHIREREPAAITDKKQNLSNLAAEEEFAQYVFYSQWKSLKDYCRKKNVQIVGDLPFYVAYDSADVWSHPEYFKLTKIGKPLYVAGVPPDYFSKAGQLWGTPIYNWKTMENDNFEWWTSRIAHNLTLYDLLRIDHFRGFVAYWQVPSQAKTAKRGKWIRAPTKSVLRALREKYPTLPFIAEDLGNITQPVRKAMGQLKLPGLRVLVFAFDGKKDNPHLPRNHVENCVTFTSTHDTNTVRGWFSQETTLNARKEVFNLIGHEVADLEISFEFVKMALNSKAELTIIPFQDVLNLGSEARLNYPSCPQGNWEWRVSTQNIKGEIISQLSQATSDANR
jgi:4-alpha-glucanotransferase